MISDEIRKQLVEATLAGVPVRFAAASAGIAERTLQSWMARGRGEEEAIAEGLPPDPAEEPFLSLYREIMQARAQAMARNVLLIQKSARGGQVIEKTERTYRNHDGELVTEKTERTQPSDWRAAAWYLERQAPGYFGKDPLRVELTGEDGGPIQVAADVQDVARKVFANIEAIAATAAVAAGRELEGGIVDADIDGGVDGDKHG